MLCLRIQGILWTAVFFQALSRLAAADQPDPHSYGNPGQVRVRHIELNLAVDFQTRTIVGRAALTLERPPGSGVDAPLVLDTRGLEIERVESGTKKPFHLEPARFTLGPADPVLGAPLSIPLPAGADLAVVTYRTSPGATALQWVAPEGTRGGKHPFLYTQSQSIHARSWIPCQDSPGVRVTYEAAVSIPGQHELEAVMSAEGPLPSQQATDPSPTARRSLFRMKQPIPPYLIALAVGNLEFRDLGPRTGVWAEPEVVEAAAREFADTERMFDAAEKRFGPYRWGRYDILILPPSFPFGGMENARLTFATPTIIAGDRSLVSLIAHELAHSWSGNLVTCATWDHFWLNEGFTTYLERRIIEDVFGREVADMERVLGREELEEELAQFEDRDETLVARLGGRDPDDGLSGVPYNKGALFLDRLEAAFGRDRFDAFLRAYFDRHAFQSLTSDQFLADLDRELLSRDRAVAADLPIEAWLRAPGLPDDAPTTTAERFEEVDRLSTLWNDGKLAVIEIPWTRWSTFERVRFVRSLPAKPDPTRLAMLDDSFEITEKSNAEIAVPWLERAIRADYRPAHARLEAFLTSIGRMRYITPLYKALVETDTGREAARRIYEKARPAYHPLAIDAVDRIVGKPGPGQGG